MPATLQWHAARLCDAIPVSFDPCLPPHVDNPGYGPATESEINSSEDCYWKAVPEMLSRSQERNVDVDFTTAADYRVPEVNSSERSPKFISGTVIHGQESVSTPTSLTSSRPRSLDLADSALPENVSLLKRSVDRRPFSVRADEKSFTPCTLTLITLMTRLR